MILSITINKQSKIFTCRLYNHSKNDVTFNFTEGINIITGRNGSGKSVLLNLIKTYCCIGKEQTYPTFVEPLYLTKDMFTSEKYSIDEYIQKQIKNKDYPVCRLTWDGSIVHYLTQEYFNPNNMWNMLDNPSAHLHGEQLFGTGDVLSSFMSKNSSGESVIKLLLKLYNLPYKYSKLETKHVNDSWANAIKIFEKWLKAKPQTGKPTLLIDELDSRLDIDNQSLYWEYLSKLTPRFQIIVVSHSIFAFKQTDCNHIKLNKKYFNNVVKLITNG